MRFVLQRWDQILRTVVYYTGKKRLYTNKNEYKHLYTYNFQKSPTPYFQIRNFFEQIRHNLQNRFLKGRFLLYVCIPHYRGNYWRICEMEEKKCLLCDGPITGRSDKKFCDDICRTAYHNRIKRDMRITQRRVNNILNANHRILSSYYNDGRCAIPRSALEESGFNFAYFTSFRKGPLGAVTYCCYEFSYRIKGNMLNISRE